MITTSYQTYEFRGLSTDDKSAIQKPQNGSVFFEMDTGKVFLYDATNNIWREI